ncbi:hypothetical protein ACIRVF_37805 [Kitasatospora sp. NPDC101157]|uniref:hypothetical protein n=1 Tax=Kitasatospora sp. NPDC101157 TaxID=3364098 RepID=UPI00382C266E
MYSYDVSAPAGRSTTSARSIPGMRPSYDAEHPHSTTPIYDELYSEYRRLFRALPGDRSGEENLRFTGFAVRDGHPLLGEQRSYSHPPQHQAFHTYAGQPSGLPQFMPAQSQHTHTTSHPGPTTAPATGVGTGTATTSDGDGHGHGQSHGHAPPPSPQFTNGQGWVAAGYLGPLPHGTPAPPPAPSPVLGTVTGLTAQSTGGRHRQMLSLPPGRAGDHH